MPGVSHRAPGIVRLLPNVRKACQQEGPGGEPGPVGAGKA